MPLSEYLNKIANSRHFQNVVIGIIFLSVILAGLENHPLMQKNYTAWFAAAEKITLFLFVLEQIIRIGAYGSRPWRYFRDPWNLFDFSIVVICFLPSSQFAAVLRLVRVLRVMRLLAKLREGELYRIKNIELAEAYRQLEKEKAESERLLLNILPLLIAKRLKEGEKIIADSYPNVSILFADLVGFTHMGSGMQATELVKMLDAVFTRFDGLAYKYGLEKIKTIGDAYMVVSGIPEDHPHNPQAVAAMALEMLASLQDFNHSQGSYLELRIGIHSGPAVAGVIGQSKFIYDLWGDSVNIASRMESHGLPGKIQVTETVYHALRGQFIFEPRGHIDVKGKGQINTWLLSACRNGVNADDFSRYPVRHKSASGD